MINRYIEEEIQFVEQFNYKELRKKIIEKFKKSKTTVVKS